MGEMSECARSGLPRDYRSMNPHESSARRKRRAGANKNIPEDPRATRIAVLTITLTVLCTVTETTSRFKELLFSKIDNTKSA